MATLTSSPQNQENYHFGAPGEHIIRHGAALPLREPKALAYTGRLDSPQQFLKGKPNAYSPLLASVLINGTTGTIILNLDEKHELGDSVTGALTVAPEVALFKINHDTQRYTVPELVTLFKRLRFFFPDKEQHGRILESLQNFSAQVTTKYEQVQNTNGSSKNNLEREVLGISWDRVFTLSVPIFKGYPAESFRVEIGVDPTSAGVKLFLDSPELFELEQDLKHRLLAQEIEYFTEWGCSIIQQS